jgi:NAD-dependent dihydropyrimidine dehydrogenase PreA subunit
MSETSRRLDRDKARRAARHPDRPGDDCRAAPGTMVPRIDRDRCEGKADCLDVCPYDVFEVRQIDEADFVRLSFFGRLRSRAHGRMTAYTPGAADCHACGLCVVACPEQAIELVAIAPTAAATGSTAA